MHTVYQSTDEFGHILRTVRISHAGQNGPDSYRGIVIADRQVLFTTRTVPCKEAVFRKLVAFTASRNAAAPV